MEEKKIYAIIGVLLGAFLIAGVYWYVNMQKQISGQTAIDLTENEDSFNKDISDLEDMDQESAEVDIDQDLTYAAGEEPTIETASMEKINDDFLSEVNDLSDDFSNLDVIGSDSSLDGLSGALSF